MRSILFALIVLPALQADVVNAQYAITATAEVRPAHVLTPARVHVSAGSQMVRIQAVEGAARTSSAVLERTFVTAASAADAPRTVWIADGRGLRQQKCDTAALELRALLRQRVIELPRNDARRVIVTRVIASNS
jgi:hypothetical protein